jgi:hypothetical protein
MNDAPAAPARPRGGRPGARGARPGARRGAGVLRYGRGLFRVGSGGPKVDRRRFAPGRGAAPLMAGHGS